MIPLAGESEEIDVSNYECIILVVINFYWFSD